MGSQSLEKLTELPNRNCKNCELNFDGLFCPRCGQRHQEGKFTLKESTFWVFDKLFNLERGLFHTIVELILRPGKTITAYLNRETIRYMHPFRFVFLLATISAILTIITGTFDSPEMIEAMQGMGEHTPERLEMTRIVVEQIKKYLTLILMLSIPINSIASLMVYKGRGYNYTEHLILNSYTYGLNIIFSIPCFLLFLLPNGLFINSMVGFPLYLLLWAWVYCKFFKENFFISLIKALVILVIASIFAGFVLFVFGAAVAFIYIKFIK